MSNTIVYQLDHLLNRTLYLQLCEWLQPKLKHIYDEDTWWSQGVYANLSERQCERVNSRSSGSLKELDLQALLHVCSKNFYALTNNCGVSWDLRSPLESVRGARNAISHQRGGQSPKYEDLLLHALNTRKLLTLIAAPAEAIAVADKVVRAITSSDESEESRGSLRAPIGDQFDRSEITEERASARESLEPVTSEEPPAPEKLADKGLSEEETRQPVVIESQVDRKSASVAVDPTREPLEGFNPVVTAILQECSRQADGTWHMTLVHIADDQEHVADLTVPNE